MSAVLASPLSMSLADAAVLHRDLSDALAQALVDLDSWRVRFTANEQARDGARLTLNLVGQSLQTVLAVPSGSLTVRVQRGEKVWSAWAQLAREHRESIRQVVEDVEGGSFTWGRLWREVVVQSASDTADLSKHVYEDAVSLTPYVATAVVALALVVGLVYLSPILVRR